MLAISTEELSRVQSDRETKIEQELFQENFKERIRTQVLFLFCFGDACILDEFL